VRLTRIILVCAVGASLAAGRLSGQSLATAQVGLARPATTLASSRQPTLLVVQAATSEPRRWPYVVSGAVVGGALGGLIVSVIVHPAAR